jgi:GntR family transcriptional regulator
MPASDHSTDSPAGPTALKPALPEQNTAAFSPLYAQIKALILRSMQSGEWKPGELIPSETELAIRYAVSQGTVRKAVDELAAGNLVTRRQGKGTFVATHTEAQAPYRFLRLVPDVGSLSSEGPAQRTVLFCKRERASAEAAKELGLRAGEAVMHASRVLAFGGVPTVVEDIWLPGGPFKALSAEQLAHHPGSTYGLYEQAFNARMVRAEEKIRALAGPDEVCALLRIAPKTALLHVQRVAYTYNDEPMELRTAYYLTDAHHYHNHLS